MSGLLASPALVLRVRVADTEMRQSTSDEPLQLVFAVLDFFHMGSGIMLIVINMGTGALVTGECRTVLKRAMGALSYLTGGHDATGAAGDCAGAAGCAAVRVLLTTYYLLINY